MPKKILVVDDSETMRIDVREALESEGYDVVEAVNGLDGVQVAQSHPDLALIMTDLNMPDMDGITMVQEIRKFPLYNLIPVFMLTTETSPDLKARGKEAGVICWIVKPFNSDKVMPIVRKILSVSQ